MRKTISKALASVFDAQRREIFLKLGSLKSGVLAGGTAIALQLLHRRSFDFDIFLPKPIPKNFLHSILDIFGQKVSRPVTNTNQFVDVILKPDIHLHIGHHPYPPIHYLVPTKSISLFDLRDLASNKAYTMGRRPVWRDYVDIFFILKNNIPLETIIKEASTRFGGGFGEKLFLEQLTYFDDIKDYTISFIGKERIPGEIKEFFKKEVEKYLKRKVRQ